MRECPSDELAEGMRAEPTLWTGKQALHIHHRA
jgi:hypothetical protein